MGRINNPSPFGHLVQLVDEDRALLCQVRHNIAVMHNLLANVDRRAKGIECDLHDVDSPHNTGAEAPRLEKKDSLGFRFAAAPVFRDVVKSGCSHGIQYTVFKVAEAEN
jgi:hypothetical protein